MRTNTRSVIKRSKVDKTEEPASKDNLLKIEPPTVKIRSEIVV